MTHTTTDAPLDTIFVNTETHLSWGDRLRVLIGRAIHIHTSIDVWNAHVGDDVRLITEARSRSWVDPFIKRRGRGGYATTEPKEADMNNANQGKGD